MGLQPASRKELLRIAAGTAVCTAVLVAVFALLSLTGLVKFGVPVVLGAVCGALVAVFNFYLLCLTVQIVAAKQDEKTSRGLMQLSYNGRLLFQAVWCIIAYALPCFQVVAAVLPLLFPRITIFFLQITGKYKSEQGSATQAQTAEPQPDEPEQER